MQPAKGTEAANLLKMCLQMPICLHKPHGYRAAEERAVLLHFPWDCQKKKKKIAMAAARRKVKKHTGPAKAHHPHISAAAPNHGCKTVTAPPFHLLPQLGSTGSH